MFGVSTRVLGARAVPEENLGRSVVACPYEHYRRLRQLALVRHRSRRYRFQLYR